MLSWKENYTCGIDSIDNQHKKLLEIGSRVYQMLKNEEKLDKYDDIMEVVHELKDYTLYHFNFEEKLMEKHGYENLEEHKKQHSAFVDKLTEMEHKDIDENQKKTMMEMLMFIADWIEKHILVSDFEYVKHIIIKGGN